ncbi:beta-glucan synthesis-associated [Thamnocephalis sphaerospora]|uniref:Beta-glucan synthesis-associated n=1 Tax=Thamnocephalis sphaerospora TaxID=78915 RepID=A0A4P9XS72_9FUNG|nr:beta-glucan synthesis-associated [Thamnocephalis sphaerospora]|eukprot:RKP08190.1 beta-glucan synthesis-associated [Thamnocephalis sphaerospora]
MAFNNQDDLATSEPAGKGGCRGRKLPRWLVIVAGVLLGLGVVFAAIVYPTLKYTVWKDKLDDTGSGDGGSNGGGGGGSGGGSKSPGNKWIDPDTPDELKAKKMEDGSEYKLVFSDEFNKDGRSFHPGKDKIWEAVNLHYWQTGDYEHYHPDQVTTKNGSMQITIEKKRFGNQDYMSGMVQTWNNFCFRGGYLEARVSLPGSARVSALWPAVWTMGNLGRAGYGASTDGLWPYSYDSCDSSVLPNQGSNNGLSRLPGQRLNKCLCSDQDTPSAGIGRASPELDLIEGAGGDGGNSGGGTVSQSHQFAPFDAEYTVQEQYVTVHNSATTYKNSYKGAQLQQAVSVKTKIPDQYYDGRDYLTYAFDYVPGPKGSARWYVGGEKKWTLDARAVAPNTRSNTGQRVISEEPMYIIMNVGMSQGFGHVDLENARFPATMYVDYVRIYQHPDRIDVTCDPKDRPTKQYIKDHPKLYNDPTLQNFTQSGYPLPQYSLNPQCSAS